MRGSTGGGGWTKKRAVAAVAAGPKSLWIYDLELTDPNDPTKVSKP